MNKEILNKINYYENEPSSSFKKELWHKIDTNGEKNDLNIRISRMFKLMSFISVVFFSFFTLNFVNQEYFRVRAEVIENIYANNPQGVLMPIRKAVKNESTDLNNLADDSMHLTNLNLDLDLKKDYNKEFLATLTKAADYESCENIYPYPEIIDTLHFIESKNDDDLSYEIYARNEKQAEILSMSGNVESLSVGDELFNTKINYSDFKYKDFFDNKFNANQATVTFASIVECNKNSRKVQNKIFFNDNYEIYKLEVKLVDSDNLIYKIDFKYL